jgi:AcrR family transcriptional regulator
MRPAAIAPPASPFRTPLQREQDRAAKRLALLVAAVRMFNEQGFGATSLDEVAASLGVTKPVIYHYLGNKDQVLFECTRIGLAQLLDASRSASLGKGTGLDRLTSFLRQYAQVIMDDFGRCVIRTGDEELMPANRARFRAMKREVDQIMRRMIQEAVDDNSIDVDDVRLAAFTLAGAINWAARWQRPGGPMDAAQIGHRMVALLCAGLAPRS